MLIAFMGVAEGMAEKRHADFPRDPQFEQPAGEGMAQVVEADITDSCPADRSLPGGLDLVDRSAFIGEDQTLVFPRLPQEIEEPVRERDFAGFTLGRLAVAYVQQAAGKIHVLPALLQKLPPPHTPLHPADRHPPQRRRRL